MAIANVDRGMTSAETTKGKALRDLEDIASEVRKTFLLDSTTPPTALAGRGVVLGSGAEGSILQLASAAMFVRITTAAVAYNHLGVRMVLPTIAKIAIAAADPTNARWDIVVATAAGYRVRKGTPAGSPADPTLTAGDLPLARVVVDALATTIVTGKITDLRSRSAGLPGGSLAAGSIATAALADGVLAASAAGRAKMADGFFTEAAATAKFAAQAIATAVLKDANVTTAKLAAGAATLPKVAVSGRKTAVFRGKNGTGAITGLTGAAIGDRIESVLLIGTAADKLLPVLGANTGQAMATMPSALFETAITVTDQLQQASATDLSGNLYQLTLVPAAA